MGQNGDESKPFASRLSRLSVVFVGCIVISLLSLSDFGRRLLSHVFVRCIVITLLDLSNFCRRLLSHVFVSCIAFSLLSLSDFVRRLVLAVFGRRLHGDESVFVVGPWVPSAISLRVVPGGSFGVRGFGVGGILGCAGVVGVGEGFRGVSCFFPSRRGGGCFPPVVSLFPFFLFPFPLVLGLCGGVLGMVEAWVLGRGWGLPL